MSNALANLENRIDREVSDAIAVGDTGITFNNAGQIMEYAKMMAVSGSAVPKHLRGNAGACLGIVDDAVRFQMSPYALARKSYFVNDNLGYEAQVLAAIVIARSPLKERPSIDFEGEALERICVVSAEFNDGAKREVRSPAFKDIKPKNSPLWTSDPDQQHSYYTLRAFARRHCPDVLLGMYDPEELAMMAARDVTPSRPAMAKRLQKSTEETQEPQEGFSHAQAHDEVNAAVRGDISETQDQQPDEPSNKAADDVVDDTAQEGDGSELLSLSNIPGDGRRTLLDFTKSYYAALDKSGRDKARSDWHEKLEEYGSDTLAAAKQLYGLIDTKQPEKAAAALGITMEELKGEVLV